MTYPKTKIEIVKLILNEAKDDPDFPWKDKSVDQLVFQWFMTGRSGSGLRLTDAGAQALISAKISHYNFNVALRK